MQPSTDKLEQGERLSTEQLLEYLPWLKEIPAPQLKWAEGAAVLRRFKPGDIVCDEGAFGSTAFYIVSGKVDIFIANKIAHVKTRRGLGGFIHHRCGPPGLGLDSFWDRIPQWVAPTGSALGRSGPR